MICRILKTNPIKYISPEIIPTGDGSNTLRLKELNETYHSTHGALQESMHVFIRQGIKHLRSKGVQKLRIFEMGFGTGLNAFLSLIETITDSDLTLEFHSIEKYPVLPEVIENMEYELLDSLEGYKKEFKQIIHAPWNENNRITDRFHLHKMEGDFFRMDVLGSNFDLIFYDAFGARAQEEMWTVEAFKICAGLMKPGGLLVTYASKGSARRALKEVGFDVEKIPGPPGKREMMRARYL